MKTGSIVECVKIIPEFIFLKSIGNFIPELKIVYVIRDICTSTTSGKCCVRLSEIKNNPVMCPKGTIAEPMFLAFAFREIEFPPYLEAEIKECLTIKKPELV